MNDGGPLEDMTLVVGRAAAGDPEAWNEIVRRYSGRVWAVCRVHRLGPADAADVFQQTWLRALENLDSLRDPAKFGAWIGTTCRNESLAVLRRARRAQPVDDSWLDDRPGDAADDPVSSFLAADRDAELWQAFRRLSRRCRDVLRVLVVEADGGRPSYELAAAALGMPIGSLGPTRGRCLAQLRRFLTEGIRETGDDS
ncbi:RNA polymerase sigma factor [Couchioplanes caeruleus]|uniref:RNA polymerase subunit sigma n=2 Tax=Couchioplanes caeruleus TaxID=56438 RepID=A0A1K0GBB3_9ACTN|nr:sigma-70 family RNA polymerase sigma factor [Couchioplanes caeruleus]OJF09454.1 RNA polymerase subunit sigma [Couchioplanes caeruleus subsp. caeruleus]ROP27797.1 RNA polymerase sigma factor (sigma-70 family) [Couchioplanes caeruleus]